MTAPSNLPAVKASASVPLVAANLDLTTDEKVVEFLSRLLPATRGAPSTPAAALLPWVCDRLPSAHSRKAYTRDLAAFLGHMRNQGIDPLQVTGDDLRMYKAALLAAGKSRTTVARALSVLRGTYEQFGKKRLIAWERVRDIQAVESPRVEKNTTPCLSQQEAIKLLHAPDRGTLIGKRDHALLFSYFLCGRPHKKYCVVWPVMWSRRSFLVQAGRLAVFAPHNCYRPNAGHRSAAVPSVFEDVGW